MGIRVRLMQGQIKLRTCLKIINRGLKVPESSPWKPVEKEKLPQEPTIDREMIDHLERMSLVEFNNQAGIERLSSAISFANKLHMVDTEGVEPMTTVLEDRELFLQEDVVTEGKCKKEVTQNASKLIEGYFVAPPGNIPLKIKNRDYEIPDS